MGESKLLLYKRDASPPSSSVMVLGDLLGLQFEYKDIDLINKENKAPEFKKINPMGTIPTLQDGDFTISESHAIMAYIVSTYGGERKEALYPSEPKTRALVDQCMHFDSGVLFIRLKEISMATLWFGGRRPTQEQKERIEDAYSVLEAYLEASPYLVGEHLTIADIGAATTANALQVSHKLDNTKLPRTVSWLARMNELPSFKSHNAPGLAMYSYAMNSSWDKNENK